MKDQTCVKLSRRGFLCLTGAAIGAVAVACSGRKTAGEPPTPLPEMPMIETTYGEENIMNGKILVTYASQEGSTASIADSIGKTLAENGFAVDVSPMKDGLDLASYRAVVAGSAVHRGQLLPEALKFVSDHRAELNRKPFAAFLVCMTMGLPDPEKRRQMVSPWLDPIRTLVKPRIEGFFPGVLDLARFNFIEALALRISVALGVFAVGDHRDWEAVRAWATALPAALG